MNWICAGSQCTKTVSSEGAYCSSCWPSETTPPPQLMMLGAAYRLNFGTASERAEAIEMISHLLFVIQHSTHQQN